MSDLPPLLAGRADLPDGGDCACCAGLDVATTSPLANRPGLSAVAYRIGSWADFRRSQLARLSSDDYPALARLRSRADDDFSIALIDAWSCVCDVLTFYQERDANEAWLGTATERQSLVELGRLIGYRPRPGVAAAADLVFLLDQPAGAAASVATVELPAGTQVQSVPGPNETPQTFETTAAIEARVSWNAIPARRTRPAPPQRGDTGAWLDGVATGLKIGDAILVVGRERMQEAGSERWDFRKLTAVTPDPIAGRTRIEWPDPLGSITPPGDTSATGQRLFALRARTSLFGWNAPHPKLLADSTRARYGFTGGEDWPFAIARKPPRIALDAIVPGFVRGGWVVLTRRDAFAELYNITDATDDGVADFAVSARVTRLTLDTATSLDWLQRAYRGVSAYGQSEELALAEAPIAEIVAGDRIELATRPDAPPPGRRLIVRGRRAQAIATAAFTLTGAGGDKPIAAGARLALLAPPAGGMWHLRDAGGFEGFAGGKASFVIVDADATAETIAEAATLEAAEPADDTHLALRLTASLAAAFDRATTLVHANVAPATHGETMTEILGSGDPSRPWQSVALKQAPLTYVSAPGESGAASTLALRVNDVLWHEAPTLYGHTPRDRLFETRTDDAGAVTVQFGDGVTGARPPAGRNNLVATYRKGIGRAGSVAANSLTTLLSRPLGLREAFNPIAASGGADPEGIDDARANAPITTLTLGRVVSLQNYEDFARGFAGIAKAKADWAWDGAARRILLSVAGPGGAAVAADSPLFANLVGSLRTLGDPFVRIAVASYRPAVFRLKLKVKIDPDYLADAVIAAIEAALRETFGFDRRGFARLVAASAVIALVQSVAGVLAVDLDLLYRTTPPGDAPILHDRLLAQPATLAPDGTLLAAEILMLDPGPIDIGAMP